MSEGGGVAPATPPSRESVHASRTSIGQWSAGVEKRTRADTRGPVPVQRRPRVRSARGGSTNCSSRAAGGGAVPGPPAAAQASRSSVQPSSVAKPTQVGRPPLRRPAAEGCTTTTFAWSQGPRQSVVRTVNRPPDASAPARSRASCRAWSMSGNFPGSPQQHPRQTTRAHGRDRAAPTVVVRVRPRGESTGTRGRPFARGASGPARDLSRAGGRRPSDASSRPPRATVRDVSAAQQTGSARGTWNHPGRPGPQPVGSPPELGRPPTAGHRAAGRRTRRRRAASRRGRVPRGRTPGRSWGRSRERGVGEVCRQDAEQNC